VKLSILIVSFNAYPFLQACLRSIYRQIVDFDFEVLVIDNASSDGTPHLVRNEFPQVHLITNEKNIGFAAANNRGLRRACGEYVFLLNSDCEVLPGCLQGLVEFGDSVPQAGMVAPQLLNSDGSLQPSGRRFPTLWRFLMEVTSLYRLYHPRGFFDPHADYTVIREVDEVTGAAIMVRREAIQQVGMLDEGFFFYWEDIDWCKRMKAHGWRVIYVPHCQVIHHFGASSRQYRSMTHFASLRSTHRYFLKHHGVVAGLFVKIVLVLREVVHLMLAMAHARPEQINFRRDSLRVALSLKSFIQ